MDFDKVVNAAIKGELPQGDPAETRESKPSVNHSSTISGQREPSVNHSSTISVQRKPSERYNTRTPFPMDRETFSRTIGDLGLREGAQGRRLLHDSSGDWKTLKFEGAGSASVAKTSTDSSRDEVEMLRANLEAKTENIRKLELLVSNLEKDLIVKDDKISELQVLYSRASDFSEGCRSVIKERVQEVESHVKTISSLNEELDQLRAGIVDGEQLKSLVRDNREKDLKIRRLTTEYETVLGLLDKEKAVNGEKEAKILKFMEFKQSLQGELDEVIVKQIQTQKELTLSHECIEVQKRTHEELDSRMKKHQTSAAEWRVKLLANIKKIKKFASAVREKKDSILESNNIGQAKSIAKEIPEFDEANLESE